MHFYTYGLFVFHITLHFTSGTLLNVLQQNIAIDLSSRPDQVFVYKLNLAEGDVIVDISNANSSNGFFVIQAHSFQSNISLSRNDKLIFGSYVIGTNIGMVESSLSKSSTYQYFINHIEKPNVEILVAVIAYGKYDPMPGGCELYENRIRPYQTLTFDKNIIEVSWKIASHFNATCSPIVDTYYWHLKENELNSDAYFDGIQKFLTVNDIRKNGWKISESFGISKSYYSAYPGKGTIYAVIASDGNGRSAYVPVVTYACNTFNWDASCSSSATVGAFVLTVVILMAIYVCYFSSIFLPVNFYIYGLILGTFIAYTSASVSDTSFSASLLIAIGFGITFGIVITIRCLCLNNCLNTFLSASAAGYTITCVLYNWGLADSTAFRSGGIYWMVLLFISILIGIISIICYPARMIALGIIGATMLTIVIDHSINGNFRYNILNNVRRISVHNFDEAILSSPCGYKDVLLYLIWLFFIISGCLVQFRLQLYCTLSRNMKTDCLLGGPSKELFQSDYGTISKSSKKMYSKWASDSDMDFYDDYDDYWDSNSA